MSRLKHNKRGVILIVTLWLLAVLSLLALSLAYRLRLEGKIVRYRFRRVEMLELARAASTIASTRINRSSADFTWFAEGWAAPVTLSDTDFGDLAPDILQNYLVEAVVFDELSRLNANFATRAQVSTFTLADDPLAGALIDWRDGNDTPVEYGAEFPYYASLVPPRKCKNDRLDSIYELLLLPDVSSSRFYGPDGYAFSRIEGASSFDIYPGGLRDLLTVYGDGPINLNTAWPEVLLAIPGLDPEMVENILYYRAGADGIERTPDDVCFESFDEMENVGAMTEFAIHQLDLHCVLKSDTFNIRVGVTHRPSGSRLCLDTVVRKGDRGLEILSWREK